MTSSSLARPGTSKLFMLHMNFRSRALRHGDLPTVPIYYLKPPSTLSADGADILVPAGVVGLVAEAEIAVIIGKRAHRVPLETAWSHVGWVAPANDVTTLDFMYAESPSLLRAKGWDSFTPVGAWVDARTVEPDNLAIRLLVNGVERQSGHSSDLIFPLDRLVAEISEQMTLEPGDIILAGTPAGAPGIVSGDEVIVELVGLSRTRNRVRDDPGPRTGLQPAPHLTAAMRAHILGVVAPRAFTLTQELRHWITRQEAAALVKRLQHQGLCAALLPAADPSAEARTILGHALTVRQVADRADRVQGGTDAAAGLSLATLRALGDDEVAVFEGCLGRSDLSELAAGWRQRPIGGVVGSGPLPGALAGLPAVALDLPATPGVDVLAGVNQPIVLGSVTVMPGDLIMADKSGVAIIAPSCVPAMVDWAAAEPGPITTGSS